MTKILEKDGWKFYVYGNDHAPPHVHVYGKQEKEAMVRISDGVVLKTKGFSRPELKEIIDVVEAYKETLLEEWEAHNG